MNNQNIFEKEIKSLSLSDLNNYYKPIVIKIVQYWQGNGQIEKWERGCPEANLHKYGQLFDKDVKAIPWRKHRFQQKVLEHLGIQIQRKVNSSKLHTFHKKYIKVDY